MKELLLSKLEHDLHGDTDFQQRLMCTAVRISSAENEPSMADFVNGYDLADACTLWQQELQTLKDVVASTCEKSLAEKQASLAEVAGGKPGGLSWHDDIKATGKKVTWDVCIAAAKSHILKKAFANDLRQRQIALAKVSCKTQRAETFWLHSVACGGQQATCVRDFFLFLSLLGGVERKPIQETRAQFGRVSCWGAGLRFDAL